MKQNIRHQRPFLAQHATFYTGFFMGGTLYSTSVLKVSIQGPHAPSLDYCDLQMGNSTSKTCLTTSPPFSFPNSQLHDVYLV